MVIVFDVLTTRHGGSACSVANCVCVVVTVVELYNYSNRRPSSAKIIYLERLSGYTGMIVPVTSPETVPYINMCIILCEPLL